MLNTLHEAFMLAALFSGVLFLLVIRIKSKKKFLLLGIALVLAILGMVVDALNDSRINSNRKVVESSPVISTALEEVMPILLSDNKLNLIRAQADRQYSIGPYVIVPIERVYNRDDGTQEHYQLGEGEIYCSSGEYISTEQLNQCRTIFFYDTYVDKMPYKSTDGRITTGKSETKTVYAYDVETRTLFEYELFYKTLPSTANSTPDLKVKMQTIIDWIESELKYEGDAARIP